MTKSTPPEHRTAGSRLTTHAPGLVDLTTGDLVVLLARTEDQTRDLRPATISTDITRPFLRHQHEILTELTHRRNRTTAT